MHLYMNLVDLGRVKRSRGADGLLLKRQGNKQGLGVLKQREL